MTLSRRKKLFVCAGLEEKLGIGLGVSLLMFCCLYLDIFGVSNSQLTHEQVDSRLHSKASVPELHLSKFATKSQSVSESEPTSGTEHGTTVASQESRVETTDNRGGAAQVLLAVVATVNPKYSSAWKKFRESLTANKGNALALQSGEVVVRYFVGGSNLSKSDQAALRRLEQEHDDVVALDCGDAYRDLTAKTMSLIRHSARHFPHVKLTWKVDLDAYVVLPGLLRKIQKWDKEQPGVDLEWVYWGAGARGGTTPRSGKWALTEKEYSPSKLAPYMNGGESYLLGKEVVKHLAQLDTRVLVREQKYIHLEDASVGMWVQVVNRKLNVSTITPSTAAGLAKSSVINAMGGSNTGPIVWVDFDGPRTAGKGAIVRTDKCGSNCEPCAYDCKTCPCRAVGSVEDCFVYSPLSRQSIKSCMFDKHDREKCCRRSTRGK